MRSKLQLLYKNVLVILIMAIISRSRTKDAPNSQVKSLALRWMYSIVLYHTKRLLNCSFRMIEIRVVSMAHYIWMKVMPMLYVMT